MSRGVFTITLTLGDVRKLQVVHEGDGAWLLVFHDREQRPLIQAQLCAEEKRALVAALTSPAKSTS